MKKNNIFRLLCQAMLASAVCVGAVSCNEKSDEPDDSTTQTISYLPNVAVTSFKLNANSSVMARLDSVHFSIDLENGVIFNADSLPKGAKINKLVATIAYSSSITSAKILMEGGTTRNDTIDYIKNPGDSIDFTGNVRLIIATANDEMKKTYTIKVNVHQQDPDSLVWNQTALAPLPSRLDNPRRQKTVDFNGKAVSLIEESDASFTLSTSDDLYANQWIKNQVPFPFMPDVRSLAASASSLYVLDTTGRLWTSADGLSWEDSGETWNKIIGGYSDTAIGLKTTADGLVYAQYPMRGLQEIPVDRNFPIDNQSNFVVRSNKWSESPVGFFCGGIKADGALSDAVWGFDGTSWVALSSGRFPAIAGASVIPFYTFRKAAPSDMIPAEYQVWMLLGGEMTGDIFNRTVYISYNNGVDWKKGDDMLQLPEMIPAMTQCDNIVQATTHQTELSDAWTIMTPAKAARVKWNVDGNTLYWECPYIYLIGGYSADPTLYNTIWRGTINRLQSAPII